MSDYFAHRLSMESTLKGPGHSLPKIFCVNWFRKGVDGRFVWPGFGQNMRVLKWMIDRLEGTAQGVETGFGVSPAYAEITWTGLDFSKAQFDSATSLDTAAWTQEFALHSELFTQLQYHLPAALVETKAMLQQRITGL